MRARVGLSVCAHTYWPSSNELLATWLQLRRQRSLARLLAAVLPPWPAFFRILSWLPGSANPQTRPSHQRVRRPGILVWRVLP